MHADYCRLTHSKSKRVGQCIRVIHKTTQRLTSPVPLMIERWDLVDPREAYFVAYLLVRWLQYKMKLCCAMHLYLGDIQPISAG